MEWANHHKKLTNDPGGRAIPKPIPYFDAADDTLLDRVSKERAERYIATGIAYAQRDTKGRIRRLYRATASRGRVSSSAAAVAVSGATQRIRDAGGTLIAPRPHVEFRPAPPRWVDAPQVVSVAAQENA